MKTLPKGIKEKMDQMGFTQEEQTRYLKYRNFSQMAEFIESLKHIFLSMMAGTLLSFSIISLNQRLSVAGCILGIILSLGYAVLYLLENYLSFRYREMSLEIDSMISARSRDVSKDIMDKVLFPSKRKVAES